MPSTENTLETTDALLEQSVVEKLENALTALQQAQAMFTNTLNQLALHNTSDPEAHLDIRQEILSIKVGTGFITNEDAQALIDTAIGAHNSSANAHLSLIESINGLMERIATLEAKVTALTPIEEDDNLTELEQRLKAIDDYYDPTLAALLSAWQVASMAGLSTADSIANEYQTLMNEKAEARANVLREFDYA